MNKQTRAVVKQHSHLSDREVRHRNLKSTSDRCEFTPCLVRLGQEEEKTNYTGLLVNKKLLIDHTGTK